MLALFLSLVITARLPQPILVDAVELNTCIRPYDGSKFTQLILWRLSTNPNVPRAVADWRIVVDEKKLSVSYDLPLLIRLRHDGEYFEFCTYIFRRTTTYYDPEVFNHNLLNVNDRQSYLDQKFDTVGSR